MAHSNSDTIDISELEQAKESHPVLAKVDHLQDGMTLPRLPTAKRGAHGPQHFANYESIDFEEPDGHLLRQHYQDQAGKRWTILAQNIFSYFLALFISIVVSLTFVLLVFSTDKIGEWRIELFEHLFEHNNQLLAVLVALGTCVGFAVFPSLFVLMITPDAIGSGMTQVIAFLNGAAVLSGVTWQTIVGKCVGVIGLVASGLYSGIDGPMAKIGSSIAIVVTRGVHKFPVLRKIFYAEGGTLAKMDTDDSAEAVGAMSLFNVLEQKNLRLFATLGAAASIAAIFRAPVGAAVFALEETTSFWEPSLMTRTIFSTTTAYIVVCVTNKLTGVSGTLLDRIFTGAATLFPTNISCFDHYSGFHILFFIFIAVCSALIGQLHNLFLSFVHRTRKRYLIDKDKKGSMRTKLWRLLEVVVVCLITAGVTAIPMAEDSVDTCSPLFNSVQHALEAAPLCAQLNSSNICQGSSISDCYQELNYVCLPLELDAAFAENLLLTYQKFRDAYCPDSAGDVLFPDSTNNATTPQDDKRYNFTYVSGEEFIKEAISGPYIGVFERLHLKFNTKLTEYGGSLHSRSTEPPASSNTTPTSSMITEAATTNSTPSSDLCYWELRSLLWTTPEKQLKLLLIRGLNGIWKIKTLLIFAGIYWSLSTLTYYIALPTDVVVPNLIIGAAFGRMAGVVINYIGESFGVYVQDPGYYALITMASFWASTSRLVLTVTVISFELTGDYTTLPVLIIVTFIGAWVSSSISPESIYHTEMENNKVPYLSHEPYAELKFMSVSQIMNQHVVCIEENMKLSKLIKYAKEETHSGFPVVEYYNLDNDGDGRIDHHHKPKPIGYVRRDRIQSAIDIYMNEDPDTNRIISLRNIMNVSPFIVRENTTAAKAFKKTLMKI
ncbi:chloride channel [Polychytrium aggregatum]|uniref:chloride channel n=1 Tax=Polychytrium aggregatum TaxID=110093 RepID=UPI0022FEA61B|nr:chloride channel [Polychytrium aggregatum]KAI9207123.1 chloride channel [Polychytrium aggregatum]